MVKGQSSRKKGLNRSKRALSQRKRRAAEKEARLLDTDITDTPRYSCTPQVDNEVADEFPPLLTEQQEVLKENPLPSQRFVCDMGHVIRQAREIEKHTFECQFGGRLIYKNMFSYGLHVTFHYICSSILCNKRKTLTSDKENNSLNNLAVLGALSTGSGFSQEEEKFSTMNVQYMSSFIYKSCEKISGDIIQSCVENSIDKAIEDEKKLAENRGDIDSDGYHCVTAVTDGGWCKRTYGHGYNASSGIAVIIGMETQKIIFVGVRNKKCLICNAVEQKKIPAKEHICFKNWADSSTAMESDIIAEGINLLEKVHNVRCMRLVGDGDSNTIKQVQEKTAFGKNVLKVECANHAVRRYARALDRLQKDAVRFSGPLGLMARKILKSRMSRLIIGARMAIKNNAMQNHKQSKTLLTKALIKDLKNGPKHVFGNHLNCGSFCTKKNFDPYENVEEKMTKSGMAKAIDGEIDRILISCSNTLIWNATNNPAENYMSQLCKTSRGKRVDFSRAGGINRRANVAVLAFQTPAQGWHATAHKALSGHSPKAALRNFIAARRKKHIKRLQRKLFASDLKHTEKKKYIGKQGDASYGDKAEKPDVSPEIFAILKEQHLEKIKVSSRDVLESETRGQSKSERWRQERRLRIPSSLFHTVAHRRLTTPSEKLVKTLIYGQDFETEATKYGIENEKNAIELYTKINPNTKVSCCGLFIDESHPFLCSSPDALVGKQGLLEVKCPYTLKFSKNLENDLRQKNTCGIKLSETGTLKLTKTHRYFYQIQGQLAITKRKWCDLLIWSQKDHIIMRIDEDTEFWDRLVPKLERFYMDCVVPEIIDPRLLRNMPLREPHWITEATLVKRKKQTQTAISKKKNTSV